MNSQLGGIVLQPLRHLCGEMGEMCADVQADIRLLRANVASDVPAAEAGAVAEPEQPLGRPPLEPH